MKVLFAMSALAPALLAALASTSTTAVQVSHASTARALRTFRAPAVAAAGCVRVIVQKAKHAVSLVDVFPQGDAFWTSIAHPEQVAMLRISVKSIVAAVATNSAPHW